MPDDVQRNGFVLHRAIRPLQDAARSQAGDKTLLRVLRVDIRTRIAEALSDVDKAASARGQQIATSDMPDPLWVDGDAARLRQALAHLLDNAVKFTDPGGRIKVSAWRSGALVRVRVSDTGCGLRPHEVANIFERFSQPRPGRDQGPGIGLDVAWEIVALHGGRIDVRSAGPSRGAEFTVTLPSTAQKE